ncbi:hypothetical protein Afil01_50720 [Actinorhabdospora filicis]|uniref:Uncharacterized protein n=1 Tax=Actinorhabdospora filicis TaxID=1785913 RepID=A0A9W6SQR2_9ACTN|nr:hypothetical protein Afil01_50720 [Actinorhabdospora filicis]
MLGSDGEAGENEARNAGRPRKRPENGSGKVLQASEKEQETQTGTETTGTRNQSRKTDLIE